LAATREGWARIGGSSQRSAQRVDWASRRGAVEQKSLMGTARSSLEGMSAPKAMGQQIGKAREDLPLRRRMREAVIEADIKDERFACGVADSPKIADGVAPEKRLREVPDFTGESEGLEERMRYRKRLSELASPHRVFSQLGEEGVRVIVKSFHVRAGEKK
jgi:hypothetical protein